MPKIGDKTQKSTLAGTEKLPIDGSQYATSQSIANLGKVKFALYSGPATLVSNGALQSVIEINTEVYDPDSLASVAGNTITVAGTGYYKFGIWLGWFPDNSLDFDGYVVIETSAPASNKVFEVAGYAAAWAIQYDERRIMTHMIHLASANQTVQVKFTNALGDDQDVQIYQFGVYKFSD